MRRRNVLYHMITQAGTWQGKAVMQPRQWRAAGMRFWTLRLYICRSQEAAQQMLGRFSCLFDTINLTASNHVLILDRCLLGNLARTVKPAEDYASTVRDVRRIHQRNVGTGGRTRQFGAIPARGLPGSPRAIDLQIGALKAPCLPDDSDQVTVEYYRGWGDVPMAGCGG
jgi:hypothetical protein